MSTKTQKIVFLGDSITDANRLWLPAPYEGLGNGFVYLAAQALKKQNKNISVINKGIDGLTLPSLIRSLSRDCYSLQPDIVSILIGINDVGISMNTGISLKEQHFCEQFDLLLQSIQAHTNAKILCMTPFIFPFPECYLNWIPETLRAEHWIQEAAQKYHIPVFSLHAPLNHAAEGLGYQLLTVDGIHLAPEGTRLLAGHWLNLYHTSLLDI